MHSAHLTTEVWRPVSKEDREAVLHELHEILTSSHFCNSKRYPALLKYVVEHALDGNSEMLKERTLGVEVFGRPADYDTNSDTVVRFTASEVRKRLLLYYSELERAPAFRISLPAGSYIPEFLPGHAHIHDPAADPAAPPSASLAEPPNPGAYQHSESGPPASIQVLPADPAVAAPPQPRFPFLARIPAPARRAVVRLAIPAAVIAVVGVSWAVYRAAQPQDPLAAFWSPVLTGQHSVPICTGSVVFADRPNYSGVTTAGRDIDYPFISMQIASAINQVSHTVDNAGDADQLLSSATTPLTDLREHSVVLLGGYNNQWTLHFLAPLRFYFRTDPDGAILDRFQSQSKWVRNRSQPYSSADDYAIVARFRDSTIDGWVVALAGLGRNGTEAAAFFATSPHYLQLLRDRLGRDFGNRNVEAVLRVNVVEGKTGSPTLLAAYSW